MKSWFSGKLSFNRVLKYSRQGLNQTHEFLKLDFLKQFCETIFSETIFYISKLDFEKEGRILKILVLDRIDKTSKTRSSMCWCIYTYKRIISIK